MKPYGSKGQTFGKKELFVSPVFLAVSLWFALSILPHSHHDHQGPKAHQHHCSICALKAAPAEQVVIEINEPESRFIRFFSLQDNEVYFTQHQFYHESRAPPLGLYTSLIS
ncbi:hypothetical protein GF338_02825 [candidate division WOR-3 bacterium]|nr:hypothetical protein [candidate division WOR-3 bacterium]